jgi:hypothetical protein
VRDAESKGRIIGVRMAAADEDDDMPWTAPPSRRRKEPPIIGLLPKSLELVLADEIYVAKENLPPGLRNRLLRLAAFQNPEFYRAQAMRLPTYDKPRIISCAEDHPKHFALPRGCLDEVQQVLHSLKIKPVIRDERCGGIPLNVSFCGTLRPEQQAAADAMLGHDTGVLAATTAFGKTVIAAWLIAQRGVNTLVLVSGYVVKNDRTARRRGEETHGYVGCGADTKPRSQRHRGRPDRGLWSLGGG